MNLSSDKGTMSNITTHDPLGIIAMISTSSSNRVLVFDSGVGGLSVLKEIVKINPDIQVIYASDNAAFPYGTKTEQELLPRIHAVISSLIAAYNPTLVVLACNTASTLALDSLRAMFSVPFVGVVPAIKPAAEASQSKVIGLLATPATIRRPYTQQLIQSYAQDCEVIKVGSSWLVELAEQSLNGSKADPDALCGILQPFLMAKEIDQLVLACTHFPLLKDDLQALLPGVTLVDSGNAVARRVQSLLNNHSSVIETKIINTGRAVFTKHLDDSKKLRENLKVFGLTSVDFIQVT